MNPHRALRKRPPAWGAFAVAILLCLVPSLVPIGPGSGPSAASPAVPAAMVVPPVPLPLPLSSGERPIPHPGAGAGASTGGAYVVNPQGYYTSEPAPMGIADFGVDQNGNGYAYNTTSFLGDIKLSSLTTSGTYSGTSMGFQLNVVMEISNGSRSYYYWVQDVAVLDTSSGSLGFENNIWNFSSSGASLSSNAVAGNGSIYSSQYYAAVASTQSGASITVSYPFDLGLRVDTATVSRSPAARFEYSDGYGWITYDVARFPWATGFKNHGYVVDGTQYNPDSLYNNAELILGGDCCAYSTQVNTGSLHLALQFWNGHNYQMITNAYNHGSNTAEGVSNATSSGHYYASNGTLYGALTAGGAQSLGVLYDRATAAIVNITTPYQDGIIYFNGTKYGAFVGGEMNLTVGPGTYAIALDENLSQVGVENITVPKGGYVHVYFGSGSKYVATYSETGLPSGTNWSVTMAGQTRWSTTSQILFPIWNGTWNYHLGLVNGWTAAARNGQVTVTGAATGVATSWSRTVYPVRFTNTGLPTGANWSVTLNGTTSAGPNPSLTFLEPNGSFAYTVGAIGGYVPSPSSGSVRVAAASISVTVAWTAFTYPVTFSSSGLPSGTPWNVTVAGRTYATTSVSLVVPVANGTHSWTLGLVPGFRATQGAQGQFTVRASNATVAFTWVRVLYSVSLVETGLPAGTSWTAYVGSVAVTGSAAALVVQRANGSYLLTVSGVPGFVPVNYPSQVNVQGSSLTVPVTFGPTTFAYTFSIAGLPPGASWSVRAGSTSGLYANVSGSSTILTLDLANGTWSFLLVLPPGYVDVSATHQVTVDGASGFVALSVTPSPGYAVGSVLPAGATVRIDGQPVTVTNGQFNVSLTPGVHSLEVTADGYTALFENFTVQSQSSVPFHLSLSRSTSSGPPSTGFLGLDPIVLVALVVLAAVAGTVVVLRRRRSA